MGFERLVCFVPQGEACVADGIATLKGVDELSVVVCLCVFDDLVC